MHAEQINSKTGKQAEQQPHPTTRPSSSEMGKLLNNSPRTQTLRQLRAAANDRPTSASTNNLASSAPAPLTVTQAKSGAGQQHESVQKKANTTGLPDNLKSGVEALSGISLDNVKVHYNSSQPAQLNALAYAQGTNIHVAPGQEKHLPHEAWHVVQQAQSRVKPTMQLKDGIPINDNQGLEQEADAMGMKALYGASQRQKPTEEERAQVKFVHKITNEPTFQMVAQPTGRGSIQGRLAEERQIIRSPTVQLPPIVQLQTHNRNSQGLDMNRFFKEFYWGMRGYARNYFFKPPEHPTEAVKQYPNRLEFDKKIVASIKSGKIPPDKGEQLRSQNNSQAEGGTEFPPHAGDELLRGYEELMQATTTRELLQGHRHAMLNSLGKPGFETLAPFLMHYLAIPWQGTHIAARSLTLGVDSVKHSKIHPVLNTTRFLGELFEARASAVPWPKNTKKLSKQNPFTDGA